MRDYLTNDGDIRIPKEEVGDIIVRARCDKGTQMRLAWSRDSNPDNPWHNKIDTDIISDTSFHVYIIDAKNALKRGLQTNDT
ncbi:MAG: hypothetical protein GWN00_24975, partial [Aliifodinibius sp.]|nr:hypothetical protein [Fodinibius sp.]NIY27938.1 hypothetical protein [Fodinibius sp.]